ncbi:Branched-chain amino acid aminotransferase/4-amino-4-deoxychorismate lyase [Sinosporangium album]|uniref:Branched-chain amino acid aminotransferase/4-amino-4-deoxychorismate lyase n=1 Tax=Sinosporangium album TaxID=504805 RepID=A0A1G7YZ78_9ACTN|nr:aminotransferase class IV family protein [Sinosporangium album]SDH01596.1 Branched-chain amino acid aminotransferase/4-amino-4-deoxychorismate lyase [Sinosporangium album]
MAELNGAPVTPDALCRLALLNYGHFTSIRVDDRRVRGMALHLDRLVRDSRTLFDADLDPDLVRGYVRRVVRGTSGPLGVRVTVFDPDLDLGRPGATAHPQVLVTVRAAGATPAPPFTARTVEYGRDQAAVKHVGLFGTIKVRRDAQLAGYDDALFVDASGHVTEGPTWNVGFFDGERVLWPTGDVLPGVTMRLLQQAHPDHAIAPVRRRDVPAMRAAFATNAAVGVRAIGAIDGVPFPSDHPVLSALRKEYEAIPAEPV